MRGAPDKVLILGCGTIGQIKAGLWLSLGAAVYLYDTDPIQVDRLLAIDERLKRFQDNTDDFIVDISTPSDQHASSLSWVFKTIQHPKTILIEKPICTNPSDKALINQLLRDYKHVPVYVNESYFWSSALDWLSSQLVENHETIVSIEINLSKNRLADAKVGRFFDKELETYGIEVPHALAVLQKLGFDKLKIVENTLYRDKETSVNQGVHIALSDVSKRTITIDSFLGDFMIQNDQVMQNSLTRQIAVTTDKENGYHISFDPAPNERRFKSVIIVNDAERIVLEDDHLRKHLECIQAGNLDAVMRYFLSPANSMSIYDLLDTLYRSKVEEECIPDDVANYYSEVGERAGVI